MSTRYFALHEITARVREYLEDALGKRFWVRAELSTSRIRSVGHFYADLVETEGGGRIIAKMELIGRRDRETRAVRWERLDDDLRYASALDRRVVAADQLRTVVRPFKVSAARQRGRQVPGEARPSPCAPLGMMADDTAQVRVPSGVA